MKRTDLSKLPENILKSFHAYSICKSYRDSGHVRHTFRTDHQNTGVWETAFETSYLKKNNSITLLSRQSRFSDDGVLMRAIAVDLNIQGRSGLLKISDKEKTTSHSSSPLNPFGPQKLLSLASKPSSGVTDWVPKILLSNTDLPLSLPKLFYDYYLSSPDQLLKAIKLQNFIKYDFLVETHPELQYWTRISLASETNTGEAYTIEINFDSVEFE